MGVVVLVKIGNTMLGGVRWISKKELAWVGRENKFNFMGNGKVFCRAQFHHIVLWPHMCQQRKLIEEARQEIVLRKRKMGNTFVHKRVDSITCGCDGPDGKVVLCNFHMKRRFKREFEEGKIGRKWGADTPAVRIAGGTSLKSIVMAGRLRHVENERKGWEEDVP